jgi:hypothetical protein
MELDLHIHGHARRPTCVHIHSNPAQALGWTPSTMYTRIIAFQKKLTKYTMTCAHESRDPIQRKVVLE